MKKLNQSGFAHLAVVAIAAVVGVVGFAGFKVYQSKQIEAKAYNWTELSKTGSAVKIYACKTANSSKTILRAYAKNTSKNKASWQAFIPFTDKYLSGQVSAGVTTNVHYMSFPTGKDFPVGASINSKSVNDGVSVKNC